MYNIQEGITTVFEYIVAICLLETYFIFCLMVLVSLYDYFFMKKTHRHLIKIENVNIIVFVVMNVIIFSIIHFYYRKISFLRSGLKHKKKFRI